MSVSVSAPTAYRPLLRFLRTPKGLLVTIFAAMLGISFLRVDANEAASKVAVAAVTAAAIDTALTYLRQRRWILPDGAVLTGVIIAFILRPQEPWLVLVGTVALAIASKHALRTHWSNIFNPAALALVVAAVFLNTGQDWWGALPDLGLWGVAVLLIAGGLIADRINKLPMVLAFLGAYFVLFAVASLFRSATVSEIFLTPDLQAVLFFAFFMLDDPPTSPVRHEDQVVFGVIVATVSYFVFMRYGGVYFLPAGLLAGNVWESARRLAVSRVRERETAAARAKRIRDAKARRRLGLAGSLGAAAIALPLVFASGVLATSSSTSNSLAGASSPSDTTAAPATVAASKHPFLPTFDADFNGNYTQTSDASSAHLLLDGLATGDVSLGVHVELAQQSVVPPPDDESAETEPDDEAEEARPVVTTTVNTAQLLDPDSEGLLCDGRLTALSGGTMRFNCDGAAAYTGVNMQIASQLTPADDGTITGALNGTMHHTS